MIRCDFFLYILIFFLGFGRFLPVFYAPDLLHEFFSVWGMILHIPAILLLFSLLGISIIKKKKRRETIIASIIYIIGWLFTPYLEDIDNKVVIWVNSEKGKIEFSNPILGMEMIKKEKGIPLPEGKVMFRFRNIFLVYDALIYNPNHGLLEEYEDTDPSMKNAFREVYRKLYNKDWYWYTHHD